MVSRIMWYAQPMAQIKTKKKRRNKNAKRYRKPRVAIGCQAFGGRTYAEAKRMVLWIFNREYMTNIAKECGGNVSEMARRADLERTNVRVAIRKAGEL